MKNIVLIGMPAAGKSTVGVVLAKATGLPFIDTDLVIQEQEKKLLQEIIDQHGLDHFLATEERAVAGLKIKGQVVATGGSVIYSPKAMRHLKKEGLLFYLKIDYHEMVKRIKNITSRGLVIGKQQNLLALYHEREPLYARYADYSINCQQRDVEDIINEIKKKMNA